MRLSKTEPSIKKNDNSVPKPPLTPIQRQRRRIKIIITAAITLFVALCIAAGSYIYHLYTKPLKVNPNEILFEPVGGQAMVNISGPGEWRITSTPKPWCYYSNVNNGLIISVDENFNSARRDTITIKGKNSSHSIYIIQESGSFYAFPENESVNANGETVSFKIMGQSDWHIANQPERWGHAYREGDYLKWSVEKNNSPNPRNDIITLRSGNKELILSINQEGRLTASQTYITVSSSATTRRIKISGPDDWNADCSEYGVSVGRDGNELIISFEKNDDSYEKEGSIYVRGAGQMIEIEFKQSGKSSGGTNYYYNPYPFYW